MGKQAKCDHTSELPPLDDDAHWMPLVEAVALLIKLAGSLPGALRRIEKAMASGKLPSVREDITTGDREHLKSDSWKENIIYYEGADPPYVSVFPGPNDKRRWNIWASDPRDEDGGYVYFVSRSHFERLWPAQQQQDRDGWQVARLKKVLPIVYPDGVPADAPDLAVQQQLVPEYEKRDWKLPSDDTIGRFRRPK